MKKKYLVAVLLSFAFNSSFANDGSPKNFKPLGAGLIHIKSETTVDGGTSKLEFTECITEKMLKEFLAVKTDCKVVYFKDTAMESDAEVTCPEYEKTRIKQKYLDKSVVEVLTESKLSTSRVIAKNLGKCSQARK
ncbi:hypothetical protein ACES2I_08725 [Bdellovibrio bacteriovorus]|uniref:hypothetical protein n=1 Tax=Bdellovibrio bacteriovorus TaxID=959 RepID=UPI0035A608EE